MAKTHEQKVYGTAVLKTSFRLRDALDSPAFKAIYPGVLRDLEITDEEVERHIADNKDAVEKAARGAQSSDE